ECPEQGRGGSCSTCKNSRCIADKLPAADGNRTNSAAVEFSGGKYPTRRSRSALPGGSALRVRNLGTIHDRCERLPERNAGGLLNMPPRNLTPFPALEVDEAGAFPPPLEILAAGGVEGDGGVGGPRSDLDHRGAAAPLLDFGMAIRKGETARAIVIGS